MTSRFIFAEEAETRLLELPGYLAEESESAAVRASPRRHRERGEAARSKREMVGCEASRDPSIESRSINNLWIGSSASRSASWPSGWPLAIATTLSASTSPIV